MRLVVPAPAPVLVPVVGGDACFPVRRVYCVGRNYVEHAREMGFTGREPPFFFMKPADAVVVVPDGERGVLPYPTETANFHHEVELVAAVGVGGADLSVEAALAHVFGYAVGLDMTRRDLQNDAKKQGRPWEVGKSFDASAPIGAIRPVRLGDAIDGFDPATAAIQLNVNGAVRQASALRHLIWSVAETLAHLSRYWRLEPGDLVFTGTPEGVGPVVPGDVLDATIDGLPALRMRVGG
jgi:fumarylpyruvate hydrolase